MKVIPSPTPPPRDLRRLRCAPFAAQARSVVVLLLLLIPLACAPMHGYGPQQFASAAPGPMVTLQGYVIAPEDEASFRSRWETVAALMKEQPGFSRVSLSHGIEGSRLWISVAEWESLEAIRAAFSKPEVLQAEDALPRKSFDHVFAPYCRAVSGRLVCRSGAKHLSTEVCPVDPKSPACAPRRPAGQEL